VRELYLPWLEDVRPDLLARYAELYARPGGYVPRADQEALTRRVHAVIDRHPRPPRPGRSWRTGFADRAPGPAPTSASPRAGGPAEGQRALFP